MLAEAHRRVQQGVERQLKAAPLHLQEDSHAC